MNAEKELLLKLLLEKYTEPAAPIASKPKKVRYVQAKRRTLARHNWTEQEKETLLRLADEGYRWHNIAKVMNLKESQVESMHYFLTHKKSKAI